MYMYCETGHSQRITMRKAYRLYLAQVDQEQKQAGTTFDSWLYGMQRSGIFVKEIEGDTSKRGISFLVRGKRNEKV